MIHHLMKYTAEILAGKRFNPSSYFLTIKYFMIENVVLNYWFFLNINLCEYM